MALAILIAEDHDAVRSALCEWINNTFPDCRVLEARNGDEALDVARAHRPGIALVNLTLPPTDGLEVTRQIKASTPQTQVIIMTMRKDRSIEAAIAAAGASACVLKHRLADELEPLLRSLSGEDASAGPAVEEKTS
jgi:DNA-binding NarL/FixJ family response regulator